jgi:hypothetical protein
MNCYECDEKDRPAVAVCQICGKGVCHEHCVCKERCLYEHSSSGMAVQLRPTGKKVGMMVCSECAEALGPSELDQRIVVRAECCPPRADGN